MSRRQRDPLRALGAEERSGLLRLSRSRRAPAAQVARATALLAVANGRSYLAAAREAGRRDGDTVAAWVARFNREGLAAVVPRHGGGPPIRYGEAQQRRILAEAGRIPDRGRDGTATWSLSTLERTVRREGLPRVGATTIRRVLRDAGSSYQRTRTWCPTGTAQRKRKAGVVRVVDPQTEEKRGPSSGRTG